MDLSLSFYKITKDTDDKSFIGEESSKMLTDITKALKALNEEATIVEIGLPEQISEDTRKRLEQVVAHFKAVSMKDTGNYVLCSYIHDSDDKIAAMFNDNGFLVLNLETMRASSYSNNKIGIHAIKNYIAILATAIGRDVVRYLIKDDVVLALIR